METAVASGLEEAFRELRAAFGAAITFGAATITAVVKAPQASRELVAGGFGDEGDATVHVLVGDLPALPALGSRAILQGKPYAVSAIRHVAGSPVAEITIRPANR